jgi:hypothetical protein
MGMLSWPGRAVVALLAYAFAYRPWQLRWGATVDEVAAELPGDDLVPHAGWEATRAVDIAARSEHVWPWLVQLGAHPRAGWYSYDWADNGGIPSASDIRPELQDLAVGDVLPMTAGSTAGFTVEAIEAGRALVLRSDDSDGSVSAAFVLGAAGAGHSRLVHRVRFRVRPTPRGVVFAAMMDVSDFIMSRRTLLGIRDRAERLGRRTRGGPPPTDHAPQTPLEFDLSVAVCAPGAEVYALLSDVQEHAPRDRVRMSKSPAGPTNVGTTWHERVRLAPGVWMRIESRATHVQPPARLEMDFRSVWFTGHLDYEIDQTSSGSTLHQRETLRLRGPLFLLRRQVDAGLRPRLLDRLADVRDTIEAHPE